MKYIVYRISRGSLESLMWYALVDVAKLQSDAQLRRNHHYTRVPINPWYIIVYILDRLDTIDHISLIHHLTHSMIYLVVPHNSNQPH